MRVHVCGCALSKAQLITMANDSGLSGAEKYTKKALIEALIAATNGESAAVDDEHADDDGEDLAAELMEECEEMHSSPPWVSD